MQQNYLELSRKQTYLVAMLIISMASSNTPQSLHLKPFVNVSQTRQRKIQFSHSLNDACGSEDILAHKFAQHQRLDRGNYELSLNYGILPYLNQIENVYGFQQMYANIFQKRGCYLISKYICIFYTFIQAIYSINQDP